MYRGLIPFMNKGMRPFIIEVKTDNTGTSTSTQFTIPTSGTGYSYTVKTSEETLTNQTGNVTLQWSTAGTYDVEIYGAFPRIFFNNAGDRLKILKVKQWGNIQWTSFENAFYGCSNMDVTATDIPLGSFISLLGCFRNCSSLVNNNGSIGSWNTGNVITMGSMFDGAISFNQNIGAWDVSKVQVFSLMFRLATSFNNGGSPDIGNWIINTNQTVLMNQMFNGATPFNQNLSNWNVSTVSAMQGMFAQCPSFNNGGSSGISNWNTGEALFMNEMFRNTAFNQPIGSWNTSKVTNMSNMFRTTSAFNQDISGWNTSNVTSMELMFQTAAAFNQNISNWDVSKVQNMNNMFQQATSFNQNLGTWNLRLLGVTLNSIFQSANSMSTANYTDTIVGWANYVFNNGGTPNNVSMLTQTSRTFQNSNAGGLNFGNAGDARTYLTNPLPTGAAWSIGGDTIIP
jgi:surface protein